MYSTFSKWIFKMLVCIFALSHFHILKSASSPSHISTDGCNVVRPDEKLRRKIAPENNIKWRYWTFFNLINISDGFDVVQLNEKTGTEYYFKSASERHKNKGKMKIFKILNLINFSTDGFELWVKTLCDQMKNCDGIFFQKWTPEK